SPRHQSSDLENAILRELAAENGVPLADVEAAVIAAEPHGVPGETLFNDHCHLNPAGNALLVRVYEKEILRALGAGK
ncbi:MAG TPA: SGNH/GDSL hydrolase family protein, partial [Candidatus Hydrogenedentes bacterium]|nr:SGNH/GDSL hydrolase family protein [Candidatus Hydrogenedentota bacterium]